MLHALPVRCTLHALPVRCTLHALPVRCTLHALPVRCTLHTDTWSGVHFTHTWSDVHLTSHTPGQVYTSHTPGQVYTWLHTHTWSGVHLTSHTPGQVYTWLNTPGQMYTWLHTHLVRCTLHRDTWSSVHFTHTGQVYTSHTHFKYTPTTSHPTTSHPNPNLSLHTYSHCSLLSIPGHHLDGDTRWLECHDGVGNTITRRVDDSDQPHKDQVGEAAAVPQPQHWNHSNTHQSSFRVLAKVFLVRIAVYCTPYEGVCFCRFMFHWVCLMTKE